MGKKDINLLRVTTLDDGGEAQEAGVWRGTVTFHSIYIGIT